MTRRRPREESVEAKTAELVLESGPALPEEVRKLVEERGTVDMVDGHRPPARKSIFEKGLDWLARLGSR